MDKQRMIREIDQEINRLNQVKRLLQDSHQQPATQAATPQPPAQSAAPAPKKQISDRSAAMKKAWARRKAAQAATAGRK